MAAGNTYVAIASTTLSSTANSITFSSIPATYTDLVIVYNNLSSSGADAFARFNGDSTSIYSSLVLSGTGSSVVGGAQSNENKIYLDNYGTPSSTERSVTIVQIQGYANTTTYKTLLCRSGRASSGVDATAGTWRSTAAITSVLIGFVSATFNSGSTFTLYGIAAA